jgi:hypothetical protein
MFQLKLLHQLSLWFKQVHRRWRLEVYLHGVEGGSCRSLQQHLPSRVCIQMPQ